MTTAVTKESLAGRIAELESGARSLKEDYTLAAYKMLLATMEAEPVAALKLPPKLSNDREIAHELNTGVDIWNRCIAEVAKINGEMIIAGRVDGLHPSTMALVNDFATALAEKLHKAELKYGYSNAWTNNGWMTECLAEFHRHIAKGDPRDVAAYCAFMWYHGWKTEAAQPAPVVESEPVCFVSERNLAALTKYRAAVKVKAEPVMVRPIALYRHAQPAPVELANIALPHSWLDGEGVEVMSANEVKRACRAALQAPGSEPSNVPGKWIPVSDRMPDDNADQQVLACFKGGDISALYYSEGRWDDAYGIVPIRQDVTHWMPLPAGPVK